MVIKITMRSVLAVLACTALLIASANCGHLWSYSITNDWQNANYVDKIILHFSLENAINANDFIHVGAPKSLGTVTAKLLQGAVSSTLTATSSGNSYFLTGKALSAMTLYKLELTLGTKPTSAGTQGLFTMDTRSIGSTTNPIIYDSNNAFAIWTVAPAPSTALTVGTPVVATAAAATKNDPSATYDVTVDITSGVDSTGFTKKTIAGGSQIIGKLSNTAYAITACSFQAFTCAASATNCKNITVPTGSTCTPTAATSTFKGFTAVINSSVTKTQIFRIQMKVQNPVTPGSASIDFWHTSIANKIIWEVKTGIALASVSTITTTVSGFKVLWNVPYSVSKPCPLGLYQPIKATAADTVPVANNFLAEFTVDKAVTGVEIGLVVALGPDSKIGGLLEGSIYHKNLTPVTNGKVTCAPNYGTSGSDSSIVCRGIGSVAASTTYAVGARVFGTVYADSNLIANYPKVTLYVVTSSASTALSNTASFAGYIPYKNSDMVSLKGAKDLATLKSGNNNFVTQHNWALAYKRAALAVGANAAISAADFRSILCLTFASGTKLMASSGCSAYYYGVYKEKTASAEATSLVLLINGGGLKSGTFDATLYPHGQFVKNSHVVHKFVMHKDFVSSSPLSAKKFGLNFVADPLGNSASSGTVKTCSTAGTDGTYCYPTYTSNDATFVDGKKTVTNTVDIYLINKYDTTDADFAVITITCVPKATGTSATGVEVNCAFKGAIKSQDVTGIGYPGFELITDAATVKKVAISSIYPDANVRDWLYCSFIVPIANVGTGGAALLTLNQGAAAPILKKANALLNWFHIDVPAAASNVKSQIFWHNAAIYENTGAANAISQNDGAHIPLLMRVQYTITGVTGTFDAAGIFFTHGSGLSFSSSGDGKGGMFNNFNKGSTANGLMPHQVSANFWQMPTSNKAGATTKVNANGYKLLTNAGKTILPFGALVWNYQKSLIIEDGALTQDFYVQVTKGSGSKAVLQNYYSLTNVVLTFLTKQSGNTQFYDVKEALIVYYTMNYLTSSSYAPKNALELSAVTARVVISGAGAVFNQFTGADSASCAQATDMYPITTDYKIGVEKVLTLQTQTGADGKCKTIPVVNGGLLGSSFAFSYITNIQAPTLFIKKVVDKTSIDVDTANCVQMNTQTGVAAYSFNSVPLQLQVNICPFKGSTALDLTATTNFFNVDLTNAIPWFWGKNTKGTPASILNELFAAGWSNLGSLSLAVGQKYAQNKPGNALVTDSCTAGAYSAILLATNTQKITWAFTNKQADMVLPTPIPNGNGLVSNANQAVTIEDDVTAGVAGALSIDECSYSVSGLNCAAVVASPKVSYTITAASTTAQTTVAKGSAITVTVFGSFTGSTALSGVKHKANAFAFKNGNVNGGNAEVQILACPTAGTDVTSSAARSKVNTLSGITFAPTNGQLSSFEFTFGFASGLGFYNAASGNAKIDAKFALGSLWNSAAISANVKCNVLTTAGALSHDFSTLTMSGADHTLTYKKTTDTPGSYKYKCVGAYSPAAYGTALTFTSNSGKGELAKATATISTATSATTIAASTSLAVATKFSTAGFASIVTLTAKFKNDITVGASTVYVYFPSSFSPKLSHHGMPSCYFNTTLVYCWFVNDYQVAVMPNKAVTNGTAVVIEIDGVDTPSAYGSYSKIVVQLDKADNNPLNGIDEHIDVAASTITALPTTSSQIPVLHYSVSSNVIRGANNHVLFVSLAANTVAANKTLIVAFADVFHFPIFNLGTTIPTCTLINEYDSASTNFVNKCEKIGDKHLKLTLNADAKNTASQIYKLEIGALETPNHATMESVAPVLFIADTAMAAVTSFTNKGYFNSSSVAYVAPAGKQLLDWFAVGSTNKLKMAKCFKGYFGSKLALNFPGNATSTGMKFTKAGSFASNFKIWQDINGKNETVTLVSGQKSAWFNIAAVDTFNNGLGLLKWTASVNDANASPIAMLPIHVDTTKCTIVPKVDVATIPVSNSSTTTSLPIVFDFSNCMPVADVGISGNLTTNTETIFSIVSTTANVTNNYDGNNQKAFMQLTAKANANLSKTGIVTFTLTGTNKASYIVSPSTLTFTTVAASTATITPDAIVATPSAGAVSLVFNCKQAATIYWGIQIGAGTITQATIKSMSQDKGIQSSKVNKTSPAAAKYGWALQSSATGKVTVSLAGDLKAGKNYTAFGYCVGQTSSNGTALTKTWTQTAIAAQVAVVHFNLSATPAQSDAQKIVNGICTTIKAGPGVVTDQTGLTCNNLVTRMLQNSTANNTNTTNNTNSTNNTNNTNTTTTPTGSSYRVLVNPDLFASSNAQTTANVAALNGKTLAQLGVSNVSVTQNGVTAAAGVTLPTAAPAIGSATKIDTNKTQWNSTTLNVQSTSNFFLFSCVFFKNETIPNIDQLKGGNNGNNTACQVKVSGKYIALNTTTPVVHQYLKESTEYQLSYVFASENFGTIDTQYSAITSANFTTKSKSFGFRASFLAALIAILAMALFI